jgi:hypothetical protein
LGNLVRFQVVGRLVGSNRELGLANSLRIGLAAQSLSARPASR